MEKINSSSNKTKKKQNAIVRYFSAYFEDFGLRQIATILLLVAGIVAIVGVSVANETATLVGFYLALVSTLCGIGDCVAVMLRIKYRKAPAFKRALVNLVILVIVLALALTGIIYTHANGIYV